MDPLAARAKSPPKVKEVPQASNKFYDSLDATDKKSKLVLMLRQRRAFESERIGVDDLGCARPRAKLPADRPKTPPLEDSHEWMRRAKRLEKPTMTRVLQALEERLEREEKVREKVEAKLLRSGPLQQSGRLSFESLPYHEKAKALAYAKTQPVYTRDAAGARPRSSTVMPKPKRP